MHKLISNFSEQKKKSMQCLHQWRWESAGKQLQIPGTIHHREPATVSPRPGPRHKTRQQQTCGRERNFRGTNPTAKSSLTFFFFGNGGRNAGNLRERERDERVSRAAATRAGWVESSRGELRWDEMRWDDCTEPEPTPAAAAFALPLGRRCRRMEQRPIRLLRLSSPRLCHSQNRRPCSHL